MTTIHFDTYLAALASWQDTHTRRDHLTEETVHNDLPIGVWVTTQNTIHSQGRLPHDQRQRLEELPQWTWGRPVTGTNPAALPTTASPSVVRGLLAELAAWHDDNAAEPGALPLAEDPTFGRLHRWAKLQRHRYRNDLLDGAAIDALDAAACWAWTDPIGIRGVLSNQELFTERLCVIEDYAATTGTTLTSPGTSHLCLDVDKTLQTIRSDFRNREISEDHKARLLRLPDWEPSTSHARFKLAARRTEASLACARPLTSTDQSWLDRIREQHKAGQLGAAELSALADCSHIHAYFEPTTVERYVQLHASALRLLERCGILDARERQVVEERRHGEILSDIASDFDISREAIRNVYNGVQALAGHPTVLARTQALLPYQELPDDALTELFKLPVPALSEILAGNGLTLAERIQTSTMQEVIAAAVSQQSTGPLPETPSDIYLGDTNLDLENWAALRARGIYWLSQVAAEERTRGFQRTHSVDDRVRRQYLETSEAAPVRLMGRAAGNVRVVDVFDDRRTRNCLLRSGITTIPELCERTEAELLQISNFGVRSLRLVKEGLADIDQALRTR